MRDQEFLCAAKEVGGAMRLSTETEGSIDEQDPICGNPSMQ